MKKLIKILSLFILIFAVSCTKGDLLPVKYAEFEVTIPVQQELISKAVFDAFSQMNFSKIKGKTAYVEVVGGFSNFSEFIKGVAELYLAKDEVNVIKPDVSTLNYKIVQFPKKADYRILVIVEQIGADFVKTSKDFFFFDAFDATLYNGKSLISVAIHPLDRNDRNHFSQKAEGYSNVFEIEEGYGIDSNKKPEKEGMIEPVKKPEPAPKKESAPGKKEEPVKPLAAPSEKKAEDIKN